MPGLCLALQSARLDTPYIDDGAAVAVEVVVAISPGMFREDVDLLRSWLVRVFPFDWVESHTPGREDSLSASDIVITAVLSGVAEEAGRAAAHAIRDRVKDLAARYPIRDRRLAEVEVRPSEEEANPPDGDDRDST